jgi:hypothetical protein
MPYPAAIKSNNVIPLPMGAVPPPMGGPPGSLPFELPPGLGWAMPAVVSPIMDMAILMIIILNLFFISNGLSDQVNGCFLFREMLFYI